MNWLNLNNLREKNIQIGHFSENEMQRKNTSSENVSIWPIRSQWFGWIQMVSRFNAQFESMNSLWSTHFIQRIHLYLYRDFRHGTLPVCVCMILWNVCNPEIYFGNSQWEQSFTQSPLMRTVKAITDLIRQTTDLMT